MPALHHLDRAAAHEIVGREPVDPLALEQDRALGHLAALGVKEVGDRLERRRLAGAVGAEQRDDPALRHAERHALQDERDRIVDDLDVVTSRMGAGEGVFIEQSRFRLAPLPSGGRWTREARPDEGLRRPCVRSIAALARPRRAPSSGPSGHLLRCGRRDRDVTCCRRPRCGPASRRSSRRRPWRPRRAAAGPWPCRGR